MSKTTVHHCVNVMKSLVPELRGLASSIALAPVRRLRFALASDQANGSSRACQDTPLALFPDNPGVNVILEGFFKEIGSDQEGGAF